MIKTLIQTTKNLFYWIKKKLIQFKKWIVMIIFGSAILAAPLVLPPNIPDVEIENKKISNKASYIIAEMKNKNPDSVLKRRVKNGLIFQMPDGKEEHKYLTGPLHWREKDTDEWIEIDIGIDNYNDETWKYHIKSAKFDTLLTDDGKKRFYPRRWISDEYAEFGTLEWQVGNEWRTVPMGIAAKLNNKLVGEKMTNHNLEIGFNGVGSRTNLIIKNQSVNRSLRYKVDLTGLTLDNGVLTSERDNENVGFMRQPYWTDSSEDLKNNKIPFEYKDGYITLTPNLENAVYPVNIDPDYSIIAGADDGDVIIGATAFNSTDTFMDFGNVTGGWPDGNIWLRFQSIAAAQGADSTAATIEFIMALSGNGTDVQTEIYGVDEDDHAAPTDYSEWLADHDIPTTANVTWDFADNPTAGNSLTTPDFSNVIDEILARGGWATGQDIGIHIDDDGSDAYDYRRPASYENTSYTEPVLSITIEAPAAERRIILTE